jgi:hypothetical protein
MMQEVVLAPELRVREHIDLVASYYPAAFPTDAVLEMTRTTALRSSLREAFGRAETAGAICHGSVRPSKAAVPGSPR